MTPLVVSRSAGGSRSGSRRGSADFFKQIPAGVCLLLARRAEHEACSLADHFLSGALSWLEVDRSALRGLGAEVNALVLVVEEGGMAHLDLVEVLAASAVRAGLGAAPGQLHQVPARVLLLLAMATVEVALPGRLAAALIVILAVVGLVICRDAARQLVALDGARFLIRHASDALHQDLIPVRAARAPDNSGRRNTRLADSLNAFVSTSLARLGNVRDHGC